MRSQRFVVAVSYIILPNDIMSSTPIVYQGIIGSAPQARDPREAVPEGPPWERAPPVDFVFGNITCTNICAKTNQQRSCKRLPNLEKACIMPSDVLRLGEETS